jgi:non-specific serine/threonine protein kinase
VLNRLGDLARVQHDYATAAAVYRDNLEIWRSLAQPLGMAASLEGVAVSILVWGQFERAARLFGAAAGLREKGGSTRGWQTDDPAGREAALAGVRTRLGQVAYTAAFAEGRGHPLDNVDAVIAGRGLTLSTPASTKRSGEVLSPREREIAGLVGQGLTTREMAAQLVVSERTVDNHVQHILRKLRGRSRGQIAVWAVQHGLTNAPAASR